MIHPGQEQEIEYGEAYVYKEATTSTRTSQPKSKRAGGGQHPTSTTYSVPFKFVESGRRNQVMICEGRKYIQNNKYGDKIYWKCSKWHDGCKARAITLKSQPDCIVRRNEHNHPENPMDKDEVKDEDDGDKIEME